MTALKENRQSTETLAIYALSGDPVTFGHLNIIERAARSFDQLIVAIGMNPAKHYLFDLDTRISLMKQSTRQWDNVSVQSFQGLLVDFAFEQNATVIIKGVRNSADVEYEHVLHQVGQSQQQGIDTHLLFAEQRFAHISSSTVKGLQLEQGFTQGYVPLPVKVALERQISDQVVIGITGGIGSGKSTVSQSLVNYGNQMGMQVHNIDLDLLAHELLTDDLTACARRLREQISDQFGRSVMAGGDISRKKLGDIVFRNKRKRMQLNALMKKPLLLKLRQAIYKKQGLILVNAALIVEADWLSLCNNRVILLTTDHTTQVNRLKQRGLTGDQVIHRLNSQLDNDEKKAAIRQRIERDNFGKLWLLSSNEPFDREQIMTGILAETGQIPGGV